MKNKKKKERKKKRSKLDVDMHNDLTAGRSKRERIIM
jgi:hypothetical protein